MADLELPSPKKRRTADPSDWLNRVGGALVGVFLAGVFALAWGDNRYLRRSEFQTHEEAQRRLEEHAGQDSATYATKAELRSHAELPYHGDVGVQLAVIKSQLSTIQGDLTWLKSQKEREKR